jgi:Carboxypeptidase regulatory-like domain/TonB-dependent Receptor Plug Domain
MIRSLPLRGLLLLMIPVGAASQQATFLGTVTDSVTGLPLPGATVSFVESARASITDDAGSFTIAGIESGLHTILIRALGYEPWGMRMQVTVTDGMEVEIGHILLVPQSARILDPIEVEGEAAHRSPGFTGFEHRMRTEEGTFITVEDIRRIAPQNTADLLKRVPGFRTLASGTVASTRGIPSMKDGFDLCSVDYFVDGVHTVMESVDNIMPNAIAGIEVYRGSASIPAAFRGPGNARCGVVAIWTLDGLRGN